MRMLTYYIFGSGWVCAYICQRFDVRFAVGRPHICQRLGGRFAGERPHICQRLGDRFGRPHVFHARFAVGGPRDNTIEETREHVQ